MTTLLSVCSLILILWTLPLRAGELMHEDSGGWSGNGGGPNRVQDNPWFLGDEPVRYCIRLSTDHPLSMTAAHAMTQRSLMAWQAFFRKYQIGPGRVNDPRLQSLQLQMSLAFTPVTCPEAELEIYLGTDNESIRLYREMNESDGPGLALRRSYDHKVHRQQGYIWIQNFTRDPRKIEHILLHELGHIFGMKHDSVFVMDRRIGPWLQKVSDADPALRFLGKIEADFWPFDLLPGSRVTLVPYARQLPPPAGRTLLQPSCPSGMISLAQIPSNLSPNIWPASGCVRLLLQKNRETDALNFQLNMSQENGAELLILFGNFAPSEPDNGMPMVPGTQSNWQNVPRGTSEWIYVPYGQRSMHARLSGYFIRGQTRYPAKLSWEEGLTLEIFIPDQARWWSIRSSGEGAP
jgi:hypothetical protein